MTLRLSWTDPVGQRPRQPVLNTPVALGSSFEAMPVEISGKSVSRMVIGDRQLRGFHVLLVEIEAEVYLLDNGGPTYLNQQPVAGQARLQSGDRIRIGSTELQLQILSPQSAASLSQLSPQYPSFGEVVPPQFPDLYEQSLPSADPQAPPPSASYPPTVHQPPNVQPPAVHMPAANVPAAPYPGSSSSLVPPRTAQQSRTSADPSSGILPGCRRRVGFLFKRQCGRNHSQGCEHCAHGYSSQAYAADYDLYEGFGRYEPGDWGYGLVANQNQT